MRGAGNSHLLGVAGKVASPGLGRGRETAGGGRRLNPPRRALGFPSRLHSLFIQLQEGGFTCPASNQSRSRWRRGAGSLLRAGAGWKPARGCGPGHGAGGGRSPRRDAALLGWTCSHLRCCLFLASFPGEGGVALETHSTGGLPVDEGTVCLHPPGKYVKGPGRSRSGTCAALFKQGITCRTVSLFYVCVCLQT